MKKIVILSFAFLLSSLIWGQKNKSESFAEQYKLEVKIPKSTAKSLQSAPTFVNSYVVSQASLMSGSQKTAGSSVFAEVSLAGIENAEFQKTVDELYNELIELLKANGIQYTDGAEFLQGDFVQEKIAKAGKSERIGNLGTKTQFEGKKKITDGSIPGYGVWAVTRDVSFYPTNKAVYETSNILKSGNFYQKAATRQNVNLLSVKYYVTFASFNGSKGYKNISLATNPVIAVAVQVSLITPKPAMNKVYFKKVPVWGTPNWSEGLVKGKDNKEMADFLGLARSAEYQVKANSSAYLGEMKSIISQLQREIIQNISANL